MINPPNDTTTIETTEETEQLDLRATPGPEKQFDSAEDFACWLDDELPEFMMAMEDASIRGLRIDPQLFIDMGNIVGAAARVIRTGKVPKVCDAGMAEHAEEWAALAQALAQAGVTHETPDGMLHEVSAWGMVGMARAMNRIASHMSD